VKKKKMKSEKTKAMALAICVVFLVTMSGVISAQPQIWLVDESNPNVIPSEIEQTEFKAVYEGIMDIGISEYGELIDPAGTGLEYPEGVEHLAIGGWWDGYTVVYRTASGDNIKYAVYSERSGIVPVSYNEIENTAEKVIVEVTTKTDDNNVKIVQTFTMFKDKKWVTVDIEIINTGEEALTDVIFKRFAEFDADSDCTDDYVDYDITRNLGFCWDVHYVGLASIEIPVAKHFSLDIVGSAWREFSTRETTDQDPLTLPAGPGEQWVLQAWELGDIAPGESKRLLLAYAAGDSETDLKSQIDEALGVLQPKVTVSTDKFKYCPCDNMTVTIDIFNPTDDPVIFKWYLGVPTFGYWRQIYRGTLPASFNKTFEVPFHIGEWGKTPFSAVWYVDLQDPETGQELDADCACWSYCPKCGNTTAMSTSMPSLEDIATEIGDEIESVA